MSHTASYNRESLRDAVRLAAKVIASKPVNHIARCVHIDGDRIRAIGDAESASVVAAPTKGSIACLVPAGDLLARLDATKEEAIVLHAEPTKLIVAAKRSRWTLDAIPVEDAPKPFDSSKTKLVDVDATALRRAIEGTLPANSNDPSQPGKYGVRLTRSGFVVATDGHRIHKMACPSIGEVTFTPQMAKLILATKAATLKMHIGNGVVVSVDGSTFAQRELGVDYAPCDRIIEKTWSDLKGSPVATVAAGEFVEAVTAAALAAEHGQVSVVPESGQLTITGRKTGDLSHCEFVGEAQPVRSGGRYLIDAVNAIGADRIDLYTDTNPSVPIMITAAGAGRDGECALIAQVLQ